MKSKQQVAVTGAFDDLKSRDLRFLQEAAKLGRVTILLWSDDVVRRITGKAPKFPEAERLYLLRAVCFVHDVKLASGVVSPDALPSIRGFRPSAWIVESPGDNSAKKKFCDEHGLKYRFVPEAPLAVLPRPGPLRVAPVHGRKKVIVTGCYDWLHSGHVRFFEEAAGYGDLYVVVGHDANIRLLKGEGRPLFPAEERRFLVSTIRFVEQALISTGNGWLDAEPEMQRIRPDIYLVNEDGDVPEKRDYCAQHGLEYVVLKRTPAPGLPKRTSTDLRGF